MTQFLVQSAVIALTLKDIEEELTNVIIIKRALYSSKTVTTSNRLAKLPQLDTRQQAEV